MGKRVLMAIGGGKESLPGLDIARSLGLELIVVDGDPQAPGFELADRVLCISTYDSSAVLAATRELIASGHRPDGVIAMCADVPVTVATIASALGLPGLDLATAHRVADKLVMKQCLGDAGIPIPKFCPVSSETPFDDLADRVGVPFVIKPVDSRGARGVQLVDTQSGLPAAIAEAMAHSPTSRVMAESFVVGPQVSTETLVDQGQCLTPGFSDRNYEWLEETHPYFIENGGDAPSHLTPHQQRHIRETAEAAALALGIRCGVAKGDMVLSEQGPVVIEIAGRLSGGYFSTLQIPLATGVNFVEQAIRLAMGYRLSITRDCEANRRAVAIRYLKTRPGTVSGSQPTCSGDPLPENPPRDGVRYRRPRCVDAGTGHRTFRNRYRRGSNASRDA